MASEIQLLKQRTIKILRVLESLYPNNNPLKAVDTAFIKNIDENVQNGYHELYLKCALFEKLTQNLTESAFLANPKKAQILIEMLFNPMLEDDILESSQLESLDNLLSGFKKINLDDLSFYPFWENDYHREFDTLGKSLATYIEWYNKNEDSLYSDAMNVISPDINNILDKIRFTADDVEQEDHRHVALEKNKYLGTTGVGNCLAIVGVQPSQPNVIVDVAHASDGFHDCISEMQNRFNEPKATTGYYIIGGIPLFLHDYLPLIYNNEFAIYDVRLARSVNTNNGNSCVAASTGENAHVLHSGNLIHQPKAEHENGFLPIFRKNTIKFTPSYSINSMFNYNAIERMIADLTNNSSIRKPNNSPPLFASNTVNAPKNRKRRITDEIKDDTKESESKRPRKSND